MRGQGYDGAKNMSRERVGTQAIVRRKAPLAVYTLCSSHCYNLVLVQACKLTIVRNMINKLEETCLFFNSSNKREGLLVEVISKNVHDVSARKPLLNLCKTRWEQKFMDKDRAQIPTSCASAIKVCIFPIYRFYSP